MSIADRSPPLRYPGVIFDLDGVLVTSDELHYRAWKSLADELDLPFDRSTNHRLRGVSRMASLEILLGEQANRYSAEEKTAFAERKNNRYRLLLEDLDSSAVLPGARQTVERLRAAGARVAVASASRNARQILRQTGLYPLFHFIADGASVENPKPAPDVFLCAAAALGVPPGQALVVEDAHAGVEAAVAAGMECLFLGDEPAPGATYTLPSLRAPALVGILFGYERSFLLRE